VRDENGAVDLPHLRNALARIPQSSLASDLKQKLEAKARRLLEAENKKQKKSADVESSTSEDATSDSSSKKISKSNRPVRLVKTEEVQTDDGEERLVFGVVLIPDQFDRQDDIYSEDEIRKAAFSFMETYGGSLKLMHQGAPLDGKAVVLETYLSKQEEQHNTEVFPKGTWFMTSRIVDDGLWGDVKAGKLTGYSIGGTAEREPLA
jgi:hypothetical protein